MEPEVTDYYVQNIFASSKWVKATDLASASVGFLSFPADVATATYLTTGANGTAPTDNTHYAVDLTALDSSPVRFIANCESTSTAVQAAIETYCRGRWDQPKCIYNIASSQSKAQLTTIGNNYQRADDVLGIIQEKWYYVTDPFATSSLAVYRAVPSVGHVMGAWIRSIGLLGIHWIPATVNTPIYGIQGVVGTQFSSADDRTDLAEAGINTTIFEAGYGYVVKTWYTPSVTKEFMFGNGILMREFIKVSVRDSQLATLNEPNNFQRIKNAAIAILNFYHRLWDVGSTGNSPSGETFGQSIDAAGKETIFSDHVYVQADLVNNPQADIDLGNRNLDSWFSFPAPSGSIRIGVGLLLR
jgi:phage tail sheath protein FI